MKYHVADGNPLVIFIGEAFQLEPMANVPTRPLFLYFYIDDKRYAIVKVQLTVLLSSERTQT